MNKEFRDGVTGDTLVMHDQFARKKIERKLTNVGRPVIRARFGLNTMYLHLITVPTLLHVSLTKSTAESACRVLTGTHETGSTYGSQL